MGVSVYAVHDWIKVWWTEKNEEKKTKMEEKEQKIHKIDIKY